MKPEQRKLELGAIYRYPRAEFPGVEAVDGLPNFYWHTATEGTAKAKLERGITRLRRVDDGAGTSRTPAVLIRSSPWKAGSIATPWHDHFDPETGVIRYYGDNKVDATTGMAKQDDPAKVDGNSYLLDALWAHQSPQRWDRANGGPVLVFTGVRFGSRQKGNVRFDGLGVVTGAEMVRQEDDRTGASYPNMLFDLQLLDLAADGNFLDWRWISGRRAAGENSETAMLAPSCWRRWIREGNDALSELRLRNWPVEPLSST